MAGIYSAESILSDHRQKNGFKTYFSKMYTDLDTLNLEIMVTFMRKIIEKTYN